MSYYKVLGLEKEPFSTSPDPDFFYHSQSHETALKRLEIAVRLRRGLSVIIGDVGTGKTTLSRTLLQAFNNENDFVFHMLLDPGFDSPAEFLLGLARLFRGESDSRSVPDAKAALEKYLFRMGAEENRTVVLLIDEAQKISLENLEVLRLLLNYETNEYKLLQLVLLGQMELVPRIDAMPNFSDRIATRYTINPLDEEETGQLIDFRLEKAGFRSRTKLFSEGAVALIHHQSKGYPRKIAMLCHQALEQAVMFDKKIIDETLVRQTLQPVQV